MKREEHKNNNRRFRFIDLLIVILCLSVMAYSINLFRLDLFQTINLQNVQPVGTIIVIDNIVQRRVADRVLWDRLAAESPVYPGDLIRAAELSAATIDMEGQRIDLGENTLIRIQPVTDGSDVLQIELVAGSLGVAVAAEGSGLQLNLMGRIVEISGGTTLTASTGKDGLAVQVDRGTAAFIEKEGNREVSSGTMIALDWEGAEKIQPAAIVTQPRPNARYVKSAPAPFPVGFAWNRVNIQPEDPLRLEIAADRNFGRIVQTTESLNTSVEISLEAGLWNWRLSYQDTILSTGRFTVVEASNLAQLSPARGSLFRYHDDQPSLLFQWSEIEEASYYIIEIASTPDFINPQINRQISAPFFVDSGLGLGTWYWRVQPVFSAAYEGSSIFSPVSFFLIEQAAAEAEQTIALFELEPELKFESEPRPELESQLEMEPEMDSKPEPEPKPEPKPEPPPVPVELRLLSPAQKARLPGLTALREQTVFRWDADGEVRNSRFVLSRNNNPLRGRPAVEITNPGRTVRLNRLEEGIWYWTVEARGVNGLVSAAAPRQLQILSVPLLPAPGGRQPSNGHRIDIEQLKTQRNITFRWSTVPGANAYVFTLYEQAENGRRQINRATVVNPTWTLEDISVLNRSTFIWQVEAVNRNSGGAIEQRGSAGENTFIMDIPLPSPVQMENPGVLYGH